MSANKRGEIVIDERKLKILQAIANDYINTGEPVGSRTIAKKHDLGISSATIRNEMADLEEMGFLEQPHSSSGRIPSSKGYRLYVDRIMEYEKLSLDEESMITKAVLDGALYEIDKILKQAGTLLSELTNLTCLVTPPSMQKSYIKSIQLVPIEGNDIICVLLTDSGVIKNNVIKVNNIPSLEVLNYISQVLNRRLKNLTIEQINLQVINDLRNDLVGYENIFNALIPTLYESLKDDESSKVFMEGTTNLLDYPEYSDIEKAKKVLSLLYDKDSIEKLIDSDENITIKIGDENFIPEAKECSVISASYYLDNKPIGSIALIGPRRINYSRVVSVMTGVMKKLNDALEQR